MAIIVEEQNGKRGPSGIIGVLIWLVILGLIGTAAYYLFFKQPELIDTAKPPSLESAEQLSRLSLDPQAVLNDARFTALKPYVTIEDTATFGRENPFIGITPAAPPRK